jgi:ethanolamine utilization protein EutA (predicted chaperonin)
MSLLQLIKDDALQARKDRNKEKANVLILLIGECERIAKDATDDQVKAVGKKMIKNLDQVIDLGTLTGSLAEIERNVLLPYFPVEEVLTVERAVAKVVADNQDKEFTDKNAGWFAGQVMKLTKGAYPKPQVDEALRLYYETYVL